MIAGGCNVCDQGVRTGGAVVTEESPVDPPATTGSCGRMIGCEGREGTKDPGGIEL